MEPQPDPLERLLYNELRAEEVTAFIQFLWEVPLFPKDLLEHFPPNRHIAFQALERLLTAFRLEMIDHTATKKTLVALGLVFADFATPIDSDPTRLLEDIDLIIIHIAVAKVRQASAKL